MFYIEIRTVEGGRLDWVAIYGDTNEKRLIRWGTNLLRGMDSKPSLRVTKGLRGPFVGAWQENGYVAG